MPSGEHLHKFNKKTQFPHNDPTKGGRPSRLAQFEKMLGIKFPSGVNIKEVEALISSLMVMNPDELTALGKNKQTPILVLIVASALIQSVKGGKSDELLKLMERVFGKPKEKIEHTGEEGGPLNVNIQILKGGDSDKG